MPRRLLACVSALLSVIGHVKAFEGQSSVSQQAVLNKYCATCHNEKLRTAGLLLDKADIGHPADHRAVWEKYLSAAANISRVAVGDRSISPTSADYQIPPDTVQTERETVDLPVGSRGGIAIRHYFPLDAEYVIKVRLQRGKDATTIVGISEQRQLDMRLDGSRLKLFTVGGENAADAADVGLEVRAAVKAGPHLVAVTF